MYKKFWLLLCALMFIAAASVKAEKECCTASCIRGVDGKTICTCTEYCKWVNKMKNTLLSATLVILSSNAFTTTLFNEVNTTKDTVDHHNMLILAGGDYLCGSCKPQMHYTCGKYACQCSVCTPSPDDGTGSKDCFEVCD